MKPRKKSAKSKLEESLFAEFRLYGLPLPVRQYKFHPERKWPFDFCWPDRKIAIEVNGGIFMRGGKGGHNRGAYMEDVFEKLNCATSFGISVFQFGPKALYRRKRTNEPSAALQFIWRLFRGAAPIPLRVLDVAGYEKSTQPLFSGKESATEAGA